MTPRRTFLICAFIAAFPLQSCHYFSGNVYKYKLSIEINTPQGTRSGSGIIEVIFRKGTAFPGPEAGGTRIKVIGDAVAVDLPGGRTLFALTDTAHSLVTIANRSDSNQINMMSPSSISGEIEVPFSIEPLVRRPLQPLDSFPRLIFFKDINDPLTVETIKPNEIDRYFGKGYSIRRISVKITEQTSQTDIAKRLKWLNRLEDYRTKKSNPFTSILPSYFSDIRRR